MNRIFDRIINITVNIAVICFGIVGMSILFTPQYQAEILKTLPQPVTNQTTKIDNSSVVDPNPNWVAVSNQPGKSGCMQNIYSQKILCSQVNLDRTLAEIKQYSNQL